MLFNQDLADIRKELHRIPEPAFRETKTRDLLLGYLQKLPVITIHHLATSTGILVEYSQGEDGYLLFRADMDGLPITEATQSTFASQHPGFMHACGHDIHMTVLLGLISKVIAENCMRNLLFLFQPAEEGMGGAESVLAEGLLQSYDIRQAFALHVSGSLPVGSVSSKPGIFFAIPQEFDVEFTGKSAHAAFPEKGSNALWGGMEFFQRVNRFIEGMQITEQVIFNIGVLKSGIIRNVIPDKCLMQGTHRTLTKELRDILNTEIKTIAQDVADEYKLKSRLDLLGTYDPVVNDEGLVAKLKQACKELGVDYRSSRIFMTGEDFGFFTTLYPGLLFWLGAGEQPFDLHSDKFLPDAECIETGVDVFYQLIKIT